MKSMKSIATIMLALVLAGVLIAWPFRSSFVGGLLFAAFEAALVGALADWFAVVALFRHPLGLKFIPHTAIIPNNRDRIIAEIVAIVEKDWLNLEFIRAKIFEYQFADGVAKVLETEQGRFQMEKLIQSIISLIINELHPDDAARFFQLLIKGNINEIKISSTTLEKIEAVIKNQYADDLIRIFLQWALNLLEGDEIEAIIKMFLSKAVADYSHQGNFFRRISKGLGESLDIINYDEAAQTLSRQIKRTLTEMQHPHNQYHIKVKAQLQKLKLSDSEATALINTLVKNMLVSEDGFKAVTEFFAAFRAKFIANNQKLPMSRYLANMAAEKINMICRDEERKTNLENKLKTALSNLLERYHGVIGKIVREKLESLDDRGLVISLEAKVGNDLQWIRINGTVIGALVGIIQYLILHLL